MYRSLKSVPVTAHYINKPDRLVLVAYIGTKQIADIISKNTSLIEERKTA